MFIPVQSLLKTIFQNATFGSHIGEDDPLNPKSQLFWIYLGIVVALVIFAGLMSGLTLGLLSLDVMSLRVLVEAGTDNDRKHAKRILPLVKRHHLLLVTLLLANAAATEALPIFLDRLLNPVLAVVISVTVVLVFGEVIPQALCSRYGLSIGALLSPLVYLLLIILFPVGYPLAKLLDLLLGSNHKTFFRRAELKALVGLHGPAAAPSLLTERIQSIIESAEDVVGRNGPPRLRDRIDSIYVGNEDPLSYDEVLIIKGALEMRDKIAFDALVPIEHTFMLDVDRTLDEKTLAEIEEIHHSRIPLYENGSRHHIIGCLLVRGLIQLSAADKVPIRRILGTRAFRELLHVDKNMPLYELLSELKTGRSNMAVIHEAADDELVANQAAQQAACEASQISTSRSNRVRVKRRSTFKLSSSTSSPVLGIVSLEDVIEELLQDEILDEMDFEVAHSLKTKNVTEACRETMTALSGTVNQMRRLRQAGQSVISREFLRQHTIAAVAAGAQGDSSTISRTLPTVSLNHSISPHTLFARSTSRIGSSVSSSNRVSNRAWQMRRNDDADVTEEADIIADESKTARLPKIVVTTSTTIPKADQESDIGYADNRDDDRHWLSGSTNSQKTFTFDR